MKKLQFKIQVRATREKLWFCLWDSENYRQWTAPFSVGSHAVSDWKLGSTIQFLNPEKSGMHALIEQYTTNEFIAFKYLGEIKNGVEVPKDWGEAVEAYTLLEADGHTELTVDINAPDEICSFLENVFPIALAVLQQMAETN